MTASAGPTPPGAAACPASSSGSPWWTAAWTSPARPAGRPGSPSSSRCAPGIADAHRDRRGRRAVPGRPGPAAGGRGPPGLRRGGRRRGAAGRGGQPAAGVGYLLKDRVADVAEFTDAVGRVAAGGTALDREVVSQL